MIRIFSRITKEYFINIWWLGPHCLVRNNYPCLGHTVSILLKYLCVRAHIQECAEFTLASGPTFSSLQNSPLFQGPHFPVCRIHPCFKAHIFQSAEFTLVQGPHFLVCKIYPYFSAHILQTAEFTLVLRPTVSSLHTVIQLCFRAHIFLSAEFTLVSGPTLSSL